MKPESADARVLDSWAVMAWLNGEQPAKGRFVALLTEAAQGSVSLAMSMVNVGEVYYLLAKDKGQRFAVTFWEDFQTTPVRIVGAPNDLILEAAQWKSRHPISYADAFALATAVREQAVLVTGDPEFQPLAERGLVRLEWIGR